MFCHGYDPEQPTDLRQMTTGLGGWRADRPPTVELTLAVGLWSAGGTGLVSCRLGLTRPGGEPVFVGEGHTMLQEPGELAILPLKLTLTLDRPGIYWAICEFGGHRLVEVPFSVTEEPAPTARD